MTEIWKDIAGYEGLYQVSNFGNVKSLPRNSICKCGTISTFKEKILKPANVKGYLIVVLCKDGKPKMYKVHRLVAQAFIENPNNYTEVNHKDEDKTNNKVDNLEWCSRKYNCNYGTRNERVGSTNSKVQINDIKKSKKVAQIDKTTGAIIKIWKSTREAGRNGFYPSHISSCCNGKLKTSQGYIWKYIDNTAA